MPSRKGPSDEESEARRRDEAGCPLFRGMVAGGSGGQENLSG